jgi:REP element-mobilizing transposase RayT
MMPYNPAIHHRRSIRLKGYDYSQSGLYFVTICCQDRICRFGKIENGEMVLNDFGKIAYNEWGKLPERYPNMFLDVFQIMPNHIHGIIALGEIRTVGATLAVALNNNAVALNNDTIILNNDNNTIAHDNGAGASPAPTTNAPNNNTVAPTVAPTVGAIVGAYKSLVANKCLEIYKLHGEYMGKLLQRDYWEHIIRNEQSYQRIANYIVNNPEHWENDNFYTE